MKKQRYLLSAHYSSWIEAKDEDTAIELFYQELESLKFREFWVNVEESDDVYE
jgi:hypothetical protein